MSSLSDGCHSIVVQNIDYIYDFIIRNIQHRRSELCKILGICDMKVFISILYIYIFIFISAELSIFN